MPHNFDENYILQINYSKDLQHQIISQYLQDNSFTRTEFEQPEDGAKQH
jgi:hypothetical protein